MPLFYTIADCPWTLESNAIDVWRFSLKNNTEYLSILDSGEKEKAARFYFDKHRRRFIQAHGIMRILLGRYANQSPATLTLTGDANGKPYIPDSGIRFNLSHSGEYALLAIGKKYSLGVDLEVLSTRDYRGIASHMFSEEECSALNTLPSPLTRAGFFSLWSQKEAFIKACGLGLRYPTQQFTTRPLANISYPVYDVLHNLQWIMFPFFPLPGYSGALCHHKHCDAIRFYDY